MKFQALHDNFHWSTNHSFVAFGITSYLAHRVRGYLWHSYQCCTLLTITWQQTYDTFLYTQLCTIYGDTELLPLTIGHISEPSDNLLALSKVVEALQFLWVRAYVLQELPSLDQLLIHCCKRLVLHGGSHLCIVQPLEPNFFATLLTSRIPC